MKLDIRGAGPAGAFLALRAAARGWSVTLRDPACVFPDAHCSTTNIALPDWPATYGVLEPDVPVWAEDFCTPAHPLRVIAEQEHVLDFGYRMLDKASVREAVQTLVDAGRVELTADLSGDAGVVVDCTGAPKDPATLWQVAVGYVLPEGCGVDEAVFMDWRGEDREMASFVYIQPVEEGWLVEETILSGPGADDVIMRELERRLVDRLLDMGVASDVVESPLSVERVRIPMNSRSGVFNRPDKQGRVYFGGAGGLINPATGYSVGASMSAADQFLDMLADERGSRGDSWGWRTALAYFLRSMGGVLIARADQVTLRSFFENFFRLPAERQVAYLLGHDGVAVARTMWELRKNAGWRHSFLQPLWHQPLTTVRESLRGL